MSSSSYTASTTSFESSATLTATRPPKDYAAAFGELQSTYGSSGHAPTPNPDAAPMKKKFTSFFSKKSKQADSASSSNSATTAPEVAPAKKEKAKKSPRPPMFMNGRNMSPGMARLTAM
ncbi:hypothetical protein JAAARDRAFT_27855 [Jaapia argillacea MUCL 33604]|uniref:Uncharacterized protein n=1 Tax=Jaapia argillacea MUCL 33604 TaxID=933084 RepID=A0A067QB83_9AGAM|nr:hypothetical protein JAAARDRAFT_27855 [Jaapia argillacea MUCL 33604]